MGESKQTIGRIIGAELEPLVQASLESSWSLSETLHLRHEQRIPPLCAQVYFLADI